MHTRAVSIFFALIASSVLGQSGSSALIPCADLHVVPAMRECSSVRTIPLPNAGVSISFPRRSERLTAEDLAQAMEEKGIHARVASAQTMVTFLNAQDPAAKLLLHQSKLSFDPSMHDEGYVLIASPRGHLDVIAETDTGLFYGAQTVKQLVRFVGGKPMLLEPTARDWPAMPHRGLSDDWSRGPIPNMEFLKREIRTLAAFKYNIFSPYFENTFQYNSTPVAAFPGGAMTPEEARELVEYAGKFHITVIPEQESFGHLHNVLRYEQYSGLGETERGAVLAPADPGSLPLIADWFKELAAIFPAPYAHIGADETFELGTGRTHEDAEKRGLDAVYIDFVRRIHDTLQGNHKRLLFWGDIAVKSPQLVTTLPKDMIAVPWEYDARPDYTNQIVPFVQAGLETWVGTGVNNWNRMYPDNNEALGNISGFVRDGQRLGAKGIFNTVWNDDGEGIFDEDWFGVLFGGAAGWQAGESDAAAFTSAFGLAFHNDPTGKISQAQQELMAVHAAFRNAGLGGASDNYYWADPFSADGRQKAAKMEPIVHDVRMHAERAIALVAEARAAANSGGWKLTNEPALDALELGARRMDFTAMKFEAASDCLTLYGHATQLAADQNRWKEVNLLLEQIGGNNGRLQDVRDGYTFARDLYRTAWLRDNRPYWLQNNLERYDRAAELWVDRADSWGKLTETWYRTHALPPLAATPLAGEEAGSAQR